MWSDAAGGWERRHARYRSDQRLWSELSLTVALGEHWSLIGRYQFGENSSWLTAAGDAGCTATTCAGGLQPSRSYQRQVALLELEAEWM